MLDGSSLISKQLVNLPIQGTHINDIQLEGRQGGPRPKVSPNSGDVMQVKLRKQYM